MSFATGPKFLWTGFVGGTLRFRARNFLAQQIDSKGTLWLSLLGCHRTQLRCFQPQNPKKIHLWSLLTSLGIFLQ